MTKYMRRTASPEIREFQDFSGDPTAQMREAYEIAAWMLQYTADGVFPVFEYNEAEPVTDSMRLYLRHPGGRTFFSFGAIRPGDFIVYENGFWNVYSARDFHNLYAIAPEPTSDNPNLRDPDEVAEINASRKFGTTGATGRASDGTWAG